MYPEPDSRANEFDDAVERRRSGDNTPIGDQEMQDLVNLALRLDEELPDDLPDPAFRQNLKDQLLHSDPAFADIPETSQEPVDLETERWHRRLIASPWRVSAAAAACLVIIVVAFAAGSSSPFGGGSRDDREETTSFQAVDADATASDDSILSNPFPLDGGEESMPESEQWFTASFPPFDVEHVVLPPLLIGFLPFTERNKPDVKLNGAGDMVDDVDMPNNASVYYLNAPPDGATMLTTLRSTLGVEGELIEGNGNGEPYRVVDEDQNDILRWDAASAFFHFQGRLLDEPVNDLLDPGAAPDDLARRFLEMIGYDLYTIEYEIRTVETDDHTEVQFRPSDFPDTALDVTLGGSVFVSDNGEILEAQLYWLSLVDIEIVALRDREAIIQDLEDDEGFSPPASDDVDEMMIDADDMRMIHVLTRLGQSNFVLQPAIKVIGDYDNDVSSTLPGPARYYVAAVEKSD